MEYDKLLVGLGKEWAKETNGSPVLKRLAELLQGKDYFVITSVEENPAMAEVFPEGKIAFPQGEEMVNWDSYTRWLSCTLNRRLLILELGEGFQNPNLIRFPFEKVAYINQKAFLYRINETFPQIAENISERAKAVKENSVVYVEKYLENLL